MFQAEPLLERVEKLRCKIGRFAFSNTLGVVVGDEYGVLVLDTERCFVYRKRGEFLSRFLLVARFLLVEYMVPIVIFRVCRARVFYVRNLFIS